jgi:glucose-6-phosphate isomerase
MGRDPERFLAGAAEARSALASGTAPWGARVGDTVTAWVEGYLRSIDHWVLLPYANALETVGAWWVQLVAESLGKASPDGIRRGIIPIRAIGPQDQHAQLQRWLDGPRNVGVVLVTVAGGDATPSDEPEACPFPGLARLSGRRILQAQADGTREALEAAGVPVLRWELDPLEERGLGAFLMAWQLIVGLTGVALEVDPFDQPAVEEGKRRTLKMLGLA